jgi:hypothetical protein
MTEKSEMIPSPEGIMIEKQLAAQMIEAHLIERASVNRGKELIDSLMNLATGTYYFEKTDKGGMRKIYQAVPNLMAQKYLFDRILGSPVSRSMSASVTEKDVGIKKMSEMIKDFEAQHTNKDSGEKA